MENMLWIPSSTRGFADPEVYGELRFGTKENAQKNFILNPGFEIGNSVDSLLGWEFTCFPKDSVALSSLKSSFNLVDDGKNKFIYVDFSKLKTKALKNKTSLCIQQQFSHEIVEKLKKTNVLLEADICCTCFCINEARPSIALRCWNKSGKQLINGTDRLLVDNYTLNKCGYGNEETILGKWIQLSNSIFIPEETCSMDILISIPIPTENEIGTCISIDNLKLREVVDSKNNL